MCVCVFFPIGIIIISFVHFKGIPDIKMGKKEHSMFMYQQSTPILHLRKKFERLSFLSVHNKFSGYFMVVNTRIASHFLPLSLARKPTIFKMARLGLSELLLLFGILSRFNGFDWMFHFFCGRISVDGHGYRNRVRHIVSNEFDHCETSKRYWNNANWLSSLSKCWKFLPFQIQINTCVFRLCPKHPLE